MLRDIAAHQDLAGENPIKALDFDKAGRIVEHHPESFETLVGEDRLSGIKGIVSSIEELVRTGRSSLLEALKAQFPPGLEYACRENRLLSLEVFRSAGHLFSRLWPQRNRRCRWRGDRCRGGHDPTSE